MYYVEYLQVLLSTSTIYHLSVGIQSCRFAAISYSVVASCCFSFIPSVLLPALSSTNTSELPCRLMRAGPTCRLPFFWALHLGHFGRCCAASLSQLQQLPALVRTCPLPAKAKPSHYLHSFFADFFPKIPISHYFTSSLQPTIISNGDLCGQRCPSPEMQFTVSS